MIKSVDADVFCDICNITYSIEHLHSDWVEGDAECLNYIEPSIYDEKTTETHMNDCIEDFVGPLFDDLDFNAAKNQPLPVINDNPKVLDLVIKDLNDRAEAGYKKYGTYLQPHNGRDALLDAYQEVLDLSKYIRQELFERHGK